MNTLTIALAIAALSCAVIGAQEAPPAQPPNETQSLETNINDRYVIEHVDVSGVPADRISQPLRDDMQALVGQRLDAPEVAAVEKQLLSEFPDHDMTRRVSRGDEPGRVRVQFQLTPPQDRRGLLFTTLRSKLVYHSDLAWGGALDVSLGGTNHRVTLRFLIGDDDRLAEEVSGYGIRFESRNLGTERLGFSFELARHRQTWDASTLDALAADPRVPPAYRKRVSIDPVVRVAIAPGLHARAGVSLSDLESLSQSPDSSLASAAVGGLGFDREWRRGDAQHNISAGYDVRAGTSRLESDLEYTRHRAEAGYRLTNGDRRFLAAFSFGRTSGAAPLFERFTLGDSTTLRGWNKFDVAPAGGERMFHQTVQYSYRGFTVFLDTGSVVDRAEDWRVRTSTGIGYQGRQFFALLGVPVNAGELRAAVILGTGVPFWPF